MITMEFPKIDRLRSLVPLFAIMTIEVSFFVLYMMGYSPRMLGGIQRNRAGAGRLASFCDRFRKEAPAPERCWRHGTGQR
jgi:hypothetical protein